MLRASLLVLLLLALGCGTPPGGVDGGGGGAATGGGGAATGGGSASGGGGGSDAGCAATDLDGQLACIPGLTWTKSTDAGVPGYTRYDLAYQQPVDHSRPDAGTFPQRLFLLARSAAAPTVLATTGYFLSTRRYELTRVYTANQLTYELRYFGASRPAGAVDWSTNTVRQSAQDAHRLVQAFKPLFPARWVSTGISRGGMTSVYHRRFFPADVDATVAVVTPQSEALADPRYPAFLSTVGGATFAACRQALVDFQRACLSRSAELLPLMPGSFTRLGKPRALEHAVIEAGFGFWQYTDPLDPNAGCGAVPLPSATAQELYAFLDTHAYVDAFTDASLEAFEPYSVAVALELGGPAPYDAPLAPLVAEPGGYVFHDARYLPAGFSGTWTATAQADVTQWVATQAERLLFLNGELDPWRAGAYAPSLGRDNFVFTLAGGNHLAQLVDLPAAEEAQAWSALDRWLQATAVPSARALLPPSGEPAQLPERRRRPPR